MDATPQASTNEPGRGDGNNIKGKGFEDFGMCHSVTHGSSFPRECRLHRHVFQDTKGRLLTSVSTLL